MSLLLGCCGVVAAGLLWRQLAGEIAAFSGASSTAVRLSLTLAFLLPVTGLIWVMQLVQMVACVLLDGDAPFLRSNRHAIGDMVAHGLVCVPALLALAAGIDAPLMPGWRPWRWCSRSAG